MHGVRLAAAAVVLLGSLPLDAAAQSDGGPCADVSVQIHGWPQSATSAKLMETIFAEVSSHPPSSCDAAESPGVASIGVEWTAGRVARLHVDLAEHGAHYVAEREIDLSHLARDGVPLALAIAADELLREAHDRAAAAAQTDAGLQPPPPAPAPRPVLARAPPHPPGGWTFGSALAAEWFSSGAALVGPDAAVEASLASSLTLALHLGLRAPFAGARARLPGATTSAGVWLRLRATGDADGGTGASAGIDLLALATPAGELRATPVPGLVLAGWHALGGGLRLAAEAGAGLPLLELQMPAGGTLGGVELRSRVSLLVDF